MGWRVFMVDGRAVSGVVAVEEEKGNDIWELLYLLHAPIKGLLFTAA